MRDAMRQAGLTPPLFESDRGQDLFVARYAFHHFLGPDDLAWLAGFKALQLGEDEAKALVFVKEFGAIDNAAYRDLAGVDTLAASQALRRLREAGLLTQKGRGSATYYVPTPGLLPPDGGTAEPLSSKPGPLSSKLGPLSSKLGPLSSKLGRLSGDLDTTAGDAESDDTASSAAARDELLAAVPGALAAQVGALGRRSVPDDVRAAVLALCTLRAWRAEDLATLLRRNVEYTRQNHLRPLIREGRLTLAYPQEPNHPQQAYRAVAAP
jgi:ATP-dependent DNA helicase RecG